MKDLVRDLRFEADDHRFRQLLDANPKVLLATGNDGRTLLHLYAGHAARSREILEVAEEHGMLEEVLTARDAAGNTALHHALFRPEAAAELVRRGADRNAVNDAGERALDPDLKSTREVEQRLLGEHVASLEQIIAVQDPDQVRTVKIVERMAQFPDRILEFVNLEKLEFGVTKPFAMPDVSALRKLKRLCVYSPCEIGESLGELVELEELSLQADSLPESLGRLSKLRRLCVAFGQLTSFPESLGDLTALEELEFLHSHVESLPISIGRLPHLRLIDGIASRLQDLPESLSELPALETIRLDGVGFQAVPEVLYRMQGVMRHGLADVPGFRGWQRENPAPERDGEVLLARTRPKLRIALDQWVATGSEWYPEFESCADAFQHVALSGIAIRRTGPETYATLGSSRFGGRPDLVGTERPAGAFVAQLNLGELVWFQDYLPRAGLLSFYRDDTAVVFVPDVSQLTGTDEREAEHDGFQISAQACLSMPYFSDDSWIYTGEAAPLAPLRSAELVDMESNVPQAPHHMNCYSASSPQVAAATHRGGLPKDWVILLNLTSDPGFDVFGTYLIHKDDLLAGDFSNVWRS